MAEKHTEKNTLIASTVDISIEVYSKNQISSKILNLKTLLYK